MMITDVYKKKGERYSKKDTFDKLVNLNPKDKYNKQKAAGSIGGSVTQGYIESDGNDYKCMKDAREEVIHESNTSKKAD